ncbi:hypothetical protein JW766_01610 [Candidatus Dojkabacteria bacterium]|nr:hypothetical protein [Candidatus Dojkabacteria bacterium]
MELLRVSIFDQYIERQYGAKKEKILYSDISILNVTINSRETIREIRIIKTNRETLILNGLENLEHLYSKLKKNCRKEVIISESHEPIDYDHPAFYVVFGFTLGILMSLFIHFIAKLERDMVRAIFVLFSLNNLISSAYFIVKLAISKRYGDKTKLIDFILSILMAVSGLWMLFWV